MIYPTNVEIRNNFCNGTSSTVSQQGIRLSFMVGGIVAGNVCQFHRRHPPVGWMLQRPVMDEGNHISNNREAGILVQGSGLVPTNNRIDGNYVLGNYTSASGAAGNICNDTATRTTITNNQISPGGEGSATIGINNTANAVYTTILNNHVGAVKSGGVAYQLAGAPTTIWEFRGNQYDRRRHLSGRPRYRCRAPKGIDRRRRHGHALPGQAVGPFDQQAEHRGYVVGDTLEVPDAASTSDVWTSKCTVAEESPGTWKTTAALP